MATRFYFPSGGTPEIAPAISAEWDKTTTRKYPLPRTPSNSSPIEVDSSTLFSATMQFIAMGQFVSEPLAAQTIAGTVKGQMRGRESASGTNATLAVTLRVLSSDGATVRGTLLAMAAEDALTTPPELSGTIGTQGNRPFQNADGDSTLTLTDVSAEAGDYLVVEVGYAEQTDSNSRAAYLVFGDDSLVDLPEGSSTSYSPHDNPWIEFSQSLLFEGESTTVEKTMSDTLAVQLSEAASLSATLEQADALSPRLDEAASIAAALASTDTLAILLSEVASLLATRAADDTLAIRLDDAPVLLALVGPVTDTLAPTLTEGAGQVVVALTVSEGLTLRLDEATSGLLVQVTRSDTAAVVLSEAAGLGAVLAASDTLRARLDDVPAIAAILTASDSLPVRLDATVGTVVLITASDVFSPKLDDGPPALLVRLQRVDSLGVGLTEGVTLDVTLSRADGLAVTLTEAATITAALTVQDWLALNLGETLTKTVFGPGGVVTYMAAGLGARGGRLLRGRISATDRPAGTIAPMRGRGRITRLS